MNYLHDVLPARVRKHVYGVLTIALAVYAVWLATEGDWTQFAVSVASAAATAMAGGNTNEPRTADEYRYDAEA